MNFDLVTNASYISLFLLQNFVRIFHIRHSDDRMILEEYTFIYSVSNQGLTLVK